MSVRPLPMAARIRVRGAGSLIVGQRWLASGHSRDLVRAMFKLPSQKNVKCNLPLKAFTAGKPPVATIKSRRAHSDVAVLHVLRQYNYVCNMFGL